MSRRLLECVGVAAVVLVVAVFLQLALVALEGQAPGAAAQGGTGATADPAPRTPWGEPGPTGDLDRGVSDTHGAPRSVCQQRILHR